MQRKQFQSNLDPELRVWLIDQKAKNLSEAARLADQYVAVPTAPSTKVMNLLPKVMLLSQNLLEHHGIVTLVEASRNQLRMLTLLSCAMSRSPQLLPLVLNSTAFAEEKVLGFCFHCTKQGHRMSNCPKRRERQELEDVPVQLVSTVPSPVTEGHVDSTAVQKPQVVDPRSCRKYCGSEATGSGPTF